MTRGEIWWADFGEPQGSETGFQRPVLIVQADGFNRSRIATVIVVPFTTNLRLADAPGNVLADQADTQLSKRSALVVSQLAAIDKQRLLEQHSVLSQRVVREVEHGLSLMLDLRNLLV